MTDPGPFEPEDVAVLGDTGQVDVWSQRAGTTDLGAPKLG